MWFYQIVDYLTYVLDYINMNLKPHSNFLLLFHNILCVDFGAAATTDEGNLPTEPGKTGVQLSSESSESIMAWNEFNCPFYDSEQVLGLSTYIQWNRVCFTRLGLVQPVHSSGFDAIKWLGAFLCMRQTPHTIAGYSVPSIHCNKSVLQATTVTYDLPLLCKALRCGIISKKLQSLIYVLGPEKARWRKHNHKITAET